jgi:RNA polymerase primary sigma factor
VSLDVSAAKVAALRKLGVSPISLDAPIGDEDDSRFGDIVQDDGAMTPYELLRVKTMRQEIREHVKFLDPREAEILTLRFGLDGQSPRTLEQVGKRFKVTRERVRQIQEIALRKLRRRVEARESTSLVGQS